MIVYILIIVLLIASSQSQSFGAISDSQGAYNNATAAINDGNYTNAIKYLQIALNTESENEEYHQLLGSLYIESNPILAERHLKKAIDKLGFSSPTVVANYIESLRLLKRLDDALYIINQVLNANHPYLHLSNDIPILFNSANVLEELGRYNKAYALIRRINILKPELHRAWELGADILLNTPYVEQSLRDIRVGTQAQTEAKANAEAHEISTKVETSGTSWPIDRSDAREKAMAHIEGYLRSAVMAIPKSHILIHLLGAHLHRQGRVDEALQCYIKTEAMKPDFIPAIANIGAALQSLGQAEDAIIVYERLLPLMPGDAGVRNNYGSLLGVMGRREEELYWLLQAYDLDPHFENININLGGFYQDDGQIGEARKYLIQASEVTTRSRDLLKLRAATIMNPVFRSWEHAVLSRLRFEKDIRIILLNKCGSNYGDEIGDYVFHKHRALIAESDIERSSLDSSLDRIHFYIVYHGLNDRYLQELVSRAYNCHISDINITNTLLAKSLVPEPVSVVNDNIQSIESKENDDKSESESSQPKKIKIGFLSKFFGLFEPHGLLLDGVMRYLPRSAFDVWALPIARTDGKPLAHTVQEAADHIFTVPLSHKVALRMLSELNLDILIFADTMSEPIAHFMAHSRLATIQIAFWGNPVTTGSEHIDYFISSDDMEHPYRTRMRYRGTTGCNTEVCLSSTNTDDEPYTEQVILIEGQGIWYYPPLTPLEDIKRCPNWNKGLEFQEQVKQASPITKNKLGLHHEWFLFICPQSVFKMHPLYDTVMVRILEDNDAHLLLTAGRRKSWTRMYRHRIDDAIRLRCIEKENEKDSTTTTTTTTTSISTTSTSNSTSTLSSPFKSNIVRCVENISERIHFIDRVSSEKFTSLLSIADVVLHPFPFDGSKTSADSIHAGKPFVTLPSEYLRGRMGLQFLKTMNISELVARNASDYIQIARNLISIPPQSVHNNFYQQIHEKIMKYKHLIWANMDIPYEWTRFLLRVSPFSTTNANANANANDTHQSIEVDISFKDFLQMNSHTLNFNSEIILHEQRIKNRKQFDEVYGNESWMLFNGIATLETHIDWDESINEKPRILNIFNDWKHMDDIPTQTSTTKIMLQKAFRPLKMLQSFNLSDERLAVASREDEAKADEEKSNLVKFHNEYHKMKTIASKGRLEAAKNIGENLHKLYFSNLGNKNNNENSKSRFFTDYGCILYQLGEYKISYEMCMKAEEISKKYDQQSSSLTSICIGVASMYLPLPLSTRDEGNIVNENSTHTHTITSFYRLKAVESFKKVYLSDYADANIQNNPNAMNDVFSVSQESVEFNYITSLRNSGLFSECFSLVESILFSIRLKKQQQHVKEKEMILSHSAIAALLATSFIDWSTDSIPALKQLEQVLTKKNILNTNDLKILMAMSITVGTDKTNVDSDTDFSTLPLLYMESKRINKDYAHIMNPALQCFTDYYSNSNSNSNGDIDNTNQMELLTQLIFQTVHTANSSNSDIKRPELTTKTTGCKSGVKLLTQYFSSNNKIVKNSILTSLTKNLSNKYITKIALFYHFENNNKSGNDENDENDENNLASIKLRNELQSGVNGSFVTTPINDPYLRMKLAKDLLDFTAAHPHLYQYQCSGDDVKVNNEIECGITSKNVDVMMNKIIVLPIEERLHFSTAIEFANTYLMDSVDAKYGGTCVAIANSDIYFDDSLRNLIQGWPNGNGSGFYFNTKPENQNQNQNSSNFHTYLTHTKSKSKSKSNSKTVLTLSKWTKPFGDSTTQLAISLRSDSQDAWIFRLPLRPFVLPINMNPIVAEANFPLGAARCDNRLASVFNDYGYETLNTAFLVRAIESKYKHNDTNSNDSHPEEEFRSGSGLYGFRGSALGEGKNVIISDVL
jgi:protein O-GlcNAc transferase